MLNKDFLNKIKEKLIKEEKRLEKELSSFAKKNIHNKSDYKAKFPDFGNETDENAKEVK